MAAAEGGRLVVELRRSGVLELLLVAPVKEREIVRGQWRAWLGMFGLPVLVLLGAHATAAALSQLSFQRLARQIPTITSSSVTTNQSGGFTNQTIVVNNPVTVAVSSPTNSTPTPGTLSWGARAQEAGMAAGVAVAAVLSTLADLLAIGWFGIWMGLTSRTANLATLKTMLFVQVIPWFVIGFGTSMVAWLVLAGTFIRLGPSQPAAWLAWYPLVNAALGAAAAVAKDLGFIFWSRKKLASSLREQAIGVSTAPRRVLASVSR